MADIRIIGAYLSPYVRKVLACLDLKGLSYEIDPIVAYMGDDRFTSLSPLRRVPVLIDDRVTLADSTVICQYLEDRYPTPALYPADVADRARARWLEEFADSRMGDVFIWGLFDHAVISPAVRKGSCSGPWASPTSRSRCSCATRRSRATRWIRQAGPAPRVSWTGCSRKSVSRSCKRSRR